MQSLELQFRLHNLLLERIGKCISFGCNRPGDQQQMLQVARRVSEAYPHRVLERASYTHADSRSWSAAAKARSIVLKDASKLRPMVEAAAKLANRALLDALVNEKREQHRQSIDVETVHVHTQMMQVSPCFNVETVVGLSLISDQHVPPTPSTLVGFSRFGQQEQQDPRPQTKHPHLSIPESWIAWHLMDEHPMSIVMQSFVYSLASRQFVAVVEETLAVEHDGMDLAHWLEVNPAALSLFLRDIDVRRERAHERWIGTISMLRLLEQRTWDRPDAVEDLGLSAAASGVPRYVGQ